MYYLKLLVVVVGFGRVLMAVALLALPLSCCAALRPSELLLLLLLLLFCAIIFQKGKLQKQKKGKNFRLQF